MKKRGVWLFLRRHSEKWGGVGEFRGVVRKFESGDSGCAEGDAEFAGRDREGAGADREAAGAAGEVLAGDRKREAGVGGILRGRRKNAGTDRESAPGRGEIARGRRQFFQSAQTVLPPTMVRTARPFSSRP